MRPSQNDLVDHMPLISEAVKRDDILSKSQVLFHSCADYDKILFIFLLNKLFCMDVKKKQKGRGGGSL